MAKISYGASPSTADDYLKRLQQKRKENETKKNNNPYKPSAPAGTVFGSASSSDWEALKNATNNNTPASGASGGTVVTGDLFTGAYGNGEPPVVKPDSPSSNGGSGSGGSSSGGGSVGNFSYPSFYDLDLSIYDNLLATLGANYKNSKNVLYEQLANALDNLDKSRRRGSQEFTAGRGLIAEDSYDRQRARMNDLASRGLAGSGLQQLGNVQEAMEKGQQVSNLADKYYAYLDDLQSQENEANTAFNSTMVDLENAYNTNVSSVEQARWNAKNQYERDLLNYMTNRANAYNSARATANAQALNDIALNQEYQNAMWATELGRDMSNPGDYVEALYEQLALAQDNPAQAQAYLASNPTKQSQFNNLPTLVSQLEGMSEKDLERASLNPDGTLSVPSQASNSGLWNALAKGLVRGSGFGGPWLNIAK